MSNGRDDGGAGRGGRRVRLVVVEVMLVVVEVMLGRRGGAVDVGCKYKEKYCGCRDWDEIESMLCWEC